MADMTSQDMAGKLLAAGFERRHVGEPVADAPAKGGDPPPELKPRLRVARRWRAWR